VNKQLIKLLIESDLHDWNTSRDKDSYFSVILEEGFKGYINWDESELKQEIYSRGLDCAY
jgi:hypothetical protein